MEYSRIDCTSNFGLCSQQHVVRESLALPTESQTTIYHRILYFQITTESRLRSRPSYSVNDSATVPNPRRDDAPNAEGGHFVHGRCLVLIIRRRNLPVAFRTLSPTSSSPHPLFLHPPPFIIIVVFFLSIYPHLDISVASPGLRLVRTVSVAWNISGLIEETILIYRELYTAAHNLRN